MEIVDVSIEKLNPHPQNPRVHPKKLIEKLKESLIEYGWAGNPLIVSVEDNTVLAGHARLKAAIELGYDSVPVFYTQFDENKANAYLIADNRLAMDSIWDSSALKNLLEDLEMHIENPITGFEPHELELLTIENMWSGDQDLDVEFEDQKDKKVKACPHCGGIL